MKLRNAGTDDLSELCDLWLRAAPAQGYAPLQEEQMRALIFENPHFDGRLSFMLEENGAHGFACAAFGDDLPGGAKRGYFSFAVTDEAAGRAGFDRLAQALEDALRHAGCETSDVLFFNPIRLPWLIPGTPGHGHNNAPGLWVECPAHEWMLARGYTERARECAMYLRLGDFSLPPALVQRQRALEAQGYRVDFYRRGEHTGLERMLRTLGNAEWEREIAACAANETPFLAALCAQEVVGFAGPVRPQPDGRGYFTGIGVVPAHEGHGLGTQLFYRLCEAEQQAGAKYMSLFTGEGNPARGIYEKAGFRAVRTFGILRKKL